MDASAVPHFRNGGLSAAAQTFGARGRQTRGDAATMVDVTAGQGTAGNSFPTLGEIGAILKRGDLALAFGILTILVVLILPLPSIVLDLFLAISITLSVLILMTSLFIQTPLEFSAFPTILLISTMLRLSLNLASTRLILSHGHEGTAAAGHVIEAFGNFVMGGNFVIGIIVFAILVIVNFIVITKGSGRIAEVAARFHLDAMPGKQMAIDADLGAGLIDEATAKKRRKELEDESGFFGAMDGASKFVRGDAIAGLLIVFINVIGGIIIGVAQQGMGFADAARTYTILTVGDGLVTQVPALIVSTAAGLLVSKAGVTGSADKALMSQLSGYPQALGMSAGVMIVLALLPGIPMIPFLALGGGAAALAWKSVRHKRVAAAAVAAEAAAPGIAAAAAAATAEEPISTTLKIDDLKIELGYALLPLVNGPDGTDRLTEQIKALRRSLAIEMGFVMPAVRILDNVQLEANTYIIKIKEVDAGTGRSGRTSSWSWIPPATRCRCPASTPSSRPLACPHDRRLAAPGRPEHRQESVVSELFDEVLGQRLPTEEILGMFLVEDLEAAERADDRRVVAVLLAVLGRRQAADPVDQPIECRRVVEPGPEVDPGQARQERRQPPLRRAARPPGRITGMTRNPASRTRGSVPPHLLVLPRPEAGLSDEHRAGPARSRASSSASCQGSPGTRCHASRNG